MGDDTVIMQDSWVAPAENGKVLVISVDATSREYDLSLCDFGVAFAKHDNARFYITMQADGAKVYYTTSDTSGKTIDNTQALTAGVAVAGFTTGGCAFIVDGGAEQVYYNKLTNRYLQIKTASGTATIRIHVSSCLQPGDY